MPIPRVPGFVRAVMGLALCAIAACTQASRDQTEKSAQQGTVSSFALGPIVDDYGDTLRLGAPARRVVSLNPTTTEIIFTIGASSQLIGRSRWDLWPDSATRIPALGDAIRPTVEAILKAQPDLVLLYASLDNQTAAARLRQAGIPTLSLKIDRIADFDRATRILGKVLGVEARANTVADSVQRTLQRVRAATQHLPPPTVVWPFSYRPVMVVGGGSYLSELIEVAGGKNIYAALSQPSPTVTIEDVVQKNPTYVLRSADVAETGPLDRGWYAVPAVREGRLLITDTDLVARPSVQLGMAAMQLAKLFHPGIDIP